MIMKKIFTILFLLVCASSVNAQQIANNSFEEWTTGLTSDPVGYLTFDSFILTDLVSKSTDVQDGNFSVKLETKDVDLFGDISRVPGIMFSSNDPAAFAVGVPYNAMPTKMKGWTKYDIPGIDTGTFVITLTRYNTDLQQTEPVGAAQAIFIGTQNNWSEFEATFEYSSTELPDTMIVLASSSITDSVNTQLSSIWFDNITLEGVSGTSVFNPIVIELLKTHPNPSNGLTNIFTPDYKNGDFLVVSDLTGRVLSITQIFQTTTSVSLNSTGVFIVEMKDNTGRTFRRSKIINQ